MKILLTFSGGALFLAVMAYAIGNYGSCAWYGYQTERNTRYAPFVGCMAEVGGRWVPRAELRTEQ